MRRIVGLDPDRRLRYRHKNQREEKMQQKTKKKPCPQGWRRAQNDDRKYRTRIQRSMGARILIEEKCLNKAKVEQHTG